MKNYKMLLIIAILWFCFTEKQDICFTVFQTMLEAQCTKIDSSCVFSNYSPRCISKSNKNCQDGNGDIYTCINIIFPNDYPKRKCVHNFSTDECYEYEPTCDDYNTLINFDENQNYCSQLKAGIGKSCHLSDNSNVCTSYYDTCSEIPSDKVCDGNLPLDYKKVCKLNERGECIPVDRICDHNIYDLTEEQYHEIKISSEQKACVYLNGICREEFINCEDIASPAIYTCYNKYPLIKDVNNNYILDDNNKCKYNVDEFKCMKISRTCEEYKGDNEEKCLSLKPIDDNIS